MAQQNISPEGNLMWYKDAIIYELHIKAFNDSNDDGIGDIRGLLAKLDYIQDLGVTAIWLLPFYPSPFRDDGYDISDYYKIDSSYGNIRQFKQFLKEAHKRDLKVITELVINHTSDQHPWFQRARCAKRGSVYRNYYVWSDDPTKYKDTRIIFSDFETSNWTWDPIAKQYYWHRFYHHQPDLNYDSPKVRQEIFKIIDYWLNMGVDGFRLDAVPYLFERENTNCENLPETHDFLKELRTHVDQHHNNKLLLAEANMWPEEAAAYFGNGDECHMNYHFPLMPRMFMSLRMEDRYPIIDIFDQTPDIPANCQWAMFLRNHDELTLEMVTDEERDYMYKVYAKDPKAKINVGIRSRLAPLLDNNRKKIELLNFLLFSLPGTPVIYYGDEIGMGDNYYLGDRDGVRTPMQWSPDRNAGFSDANPNQLYLPVNLDPEYQFGAINVETQRQNPSSLFWWMKRMILVRKQYAAFGRGDTTFLWADNPKVLSFMRKYQDQTILVIANLSRFSQSAQIDLSEYRDYIPVEIFSQNKFPPVREEPYLFMLGPHGYYWFLLEKTEADSGDDEGKGKGKEIMLKMNKWEELVEDKTRKVLENNVLPLYLKKCRWFGGKARRIQRIKVSEHFLFPTDKGEIWWLIIEVRYLEGLPEYYQIPVSFVSEEELDHFHETSPQVIIGAAQLGNEKGYIFDALYNEAFQHALLQKITLKRKVRYKGATIGFRLMNKFDELVRKLKANINSRVLGVEQSNSSIIYNDRLFLKLYRKLERHINPDVEITEFLTKKTGFDNIPDYVGSIEFGKKGETPVILAMIQELVQNEGDAWSHFEDVLARYFENVLAKPENSTIPSKLGSFADPVDFSEMPEPLQTMIGADNAEMIELLGRRTAEMHKALASRPQQSDFEPEPSSLHYQRSIYSSIQPLLRSAYQNLSSGIKKLPAEIKDEAKEIQNLRSTAQKCLRRIYSRKIDTLKIRTHGDYHLGQVLFTGKDFIIIDFEGEPARPYSERRLKRSPLRDVAGMIRSLHYAAYNALFYLHSMGGPDTTDLEKWADHWNHYMSSFYMKAYLETVKEESFVPKDHENLEILLQTFLLEKAIYEMNYELNNRPDWILIPFRGIKEILYNYLDEQDK